MLATIAREENVASALREALRRHCCDATWYDDALKVGADDLANLRASGLTDETIRCNGLRTENGTLVFPYCNLNGKWDGFARTRPHNPRVRDGKAVKYEQPKGVPPRAHFPVSCISAIRRGQGPIYVTEGEKKSMALSQHGLPAVGLGGTWCWKQKGSDELIPDLAAIDWHGLVVYIVFDWDVRKETRWHVDLAAQQLAKALKVAGAKEVLRVEMPSGPEGRKNGVDDFLVAAGDEGGQMFGELVAVAKPISTGVRPVQVAAGRTDATNAVRLIDRFGSDVRWVGTWDKWLAWDGRRWRMDQVRRMDRHAKYVADRIWKEIAAVVATGDVDAATVNSMYSFGKASNAAGGVRAMLALARSEPGVAIAIDELDADPWLLNVTNGTVDLKTGELRKHRRGDWITKMAPVAFDPEAVCPIWNKFLSRIFAEHDELAGYMQRLAGYVLTGTTEEHLLPFLFGLGANGKSTLVEILLKMLGSDYSMKAPPDLLLAKRGESHPTERADLFGKRFVAAVETEAGRRLAESLVKELTGGDRIRARRMREDFWEFAPTHKVWLAGNHKPRVFGTDHGIWRRLKLIPFDVTIPDDEQDKKLPLKLAAELPGILNWAIAGCLDWQRDGMQEPAVVIEATKEYAEEGDEVGDFIAGECVLGEEFKAPATQLFEMFQHKNPASKMSQHIFGQNLSQRGFRSVRITAGPQKGRKAWQGLKLGISDFVASLEKKREVK